jgi:hypothetical protein
MAKFDRAYIIILSNTKHALAACTKKIYAKFELQGMRPIYLKRCQCLVLNTGKN